MQEQAEACPGCSRQWVETTDPEAFEDYQAIGVVCHACAERERKRAKYQKAEAGAPEGLFIAVHRREDA